MLKPIRVISKNNSALFGDQKAADLSHLKALIESLEMENKAKTQQLQTLAIQSKNSKQEENFLREKETGILQLLASRAQQNDLVARTVQSKQTQVEKLDAERKKLENVLNELRS